MSIISLNLNTPPASVETRNNVLENPSVSLGNLGALWSWLNGGTETSSGELVDAEVAQRIIWVYSAVRLIAETVSSIPLKLYEVLEKGRREAAENNLYQLLKIEPNPEMGAVNYWEQVIWGLCFTGNSYSYCQRIAGQVEAIWPLNPQRTRPFRLPSGQLAFENRENGTEIKVYQAADVLHFRLASWDGLLGLSPIHLAKEELGIARSSQKMLGRLMSNNGRPSGIMSQDGTSTLDEKMLLNFRESWQASQSGHNQFKTAFLPGQWKYTPVSLDLESLQFIQQMKMSREAIASLFRVPASYLGSMEKESQHTAEQNALSLIQSTILPYLTRIENEVSRKLLPSVGRNSGRFMFQFDTRDLTRGDFQTQMAGYALGKQWGFFSTNMILAELGENPVGPVGDVLIVPLNFQNAENMLVKPGPVGPPAPTPTKEAPPLVPLDKQTDPAASTDQERSIALQASSLLPIFKDSIGRLLHREQRDLTTIQATCEPVLRSFVSLSVADANTKLGVDWQNDAAIDKIVKTTCQSIERRAVAWSSDQVDVIVPEEFRKALRGVVASVYREVAAFSVSTPDK